MNRSVYFSVSASVGLLIFSQAAMAADAKTDAASLMKALEAQAARLAQQEKKLSEHESAIEDQRRSLAQEKMQFQKLKMQVSTLTGKSIAIDDTPDTVKEVKKEQQEKKEGSKEVGIERKQSTEKPPEIAAVIEEGGVLLGRGKAVLTPAMEYTHSSATRVAVDGFSIVPAVNIGLFDISRVNRDTMIPSIGLRYGVTNRIEIEGKIPYVWRTDDTTSRPIGVPGAPETLSSVTGHDIGDVEAGIHYQVNKGEGGWPYFIANMRIKSNTGVSPFEVPVVGGLQTELPTGSGFWAAQPSVTAIYPSDPVVFYANWGYLYNFGASFPLYGDVDPGDSISSSFGMSLSLNEKSSFSWGYNHSMVFKTRINGQDIANSTNLQVGSVDLGYSYALNDWINLNFTVSTGVTEDAPDVRLIWRVPMTFDLR